MASDNIYDIIISEEVARADGGAASNDNGTSIVGLVIGMDYPAYVASGKALPIGAEYITVTSAVSNLPVEWAVVPNSHTIYYDYEEGAGFIAYTPGDLIGDDNVQIVHDNHGGIAGAAGTVRRRYYSTLTIADIDNSANTLQITSDIILITSVSEIQYGFSENDPVIGPDYLSEKVLSTEDILPIESNNPTLPNLQYMYIMITDGDAQPLAIADEHGLITEISEWNGRDNIVAGFFMYRSPFTMELTGLYTHNFTLIYS